MQEDWFAIFNVTLRVYIIKHDTFYLSTELLILLEPNLIEWYLIKSWYVLSKNWIVVFKVKVTVKVQKFMESLCILYLLYHWSPGTQSRCADETLLLLPNLYNKVDIYWQ